MTSLVAVTIGALIVVPALVSIYRSFQRVQALWGYMQSGLNSSWQAQLPEGG